MLPCMLSAAVLTRKSMVGWRGVAPLYTVPFAGCCEATRTVGPYLHCFRHLHDLTAILLPSAAFCRPCSRTGAPRFMHVLPVQTAVKESE